MLRRVFVEENQRPDITTFIANVCATEEWYNENVVFEGCLARIRRPMDCVGPDGWVRCERVSHEGLDPQSSYPYNLPEHTLEHEVLVMDNVRRFVLIPKQIPLLRGVFNSFPAHDIPTRDDQPFIPISGAKIHRMLSCVLER